MFRKLGHVIAHHPWVFVVGWVLVLAFAASGAFAGWGHGSLFDRLDNSVSLVKGSDSDQVNTLTSADAEGAAVTVVVSGVNIPEDVPSLIQIMSVQRTAFKKLPNVASETDPFIQGAPDTPQAQALLSDKKDGFVISLKLKKNISDSAQTTAINRIHDASDAFQADLRKTFPQASCNIMSSHDFSSAIANQTQADLEKGETIGLPLALILLIIIFGGIIAAGLPIVGAVVSIGIGMGALWAFTFSTSVESFVLNVVSIVGLALSIDYGLLAVSRYREELSDLLAKAGYTRDNIGNIKKSRAAKIVRQAVENTVATAGRTVFFSALTIAMAMLGLVIMKADLLRVIAAGGMIVTLLAVLTAITLVPALITLLGRKLIRPSIITHIPGVRKVVRALGDTSADKGFFSQLAHRVQRHPWLVMVGTLIILGVMTAPLADLHARTDYTDYLPKGKQVTNAYDTIQNDYPALKNASIIIVADTSPDNTGALITHAREVTNADFVSSPAPVPEHPGKSYFTLHIDTSNQVGSQITKEVKQLRNFDAGYKVQIGGPAALQLDFTDSILQGAPWSAGIMAVAVFVLIFLMTGSLLVPLKALIINSLSLLASLGATTFIFMNGYLGMPKVLGMETFILACTVCFGFGLAMDYEVFLIARIKEFWDSGDGPELSVAHGLQRSGRIITSAAIIIVAVFIGFTAGDMVPIKEIGVALAITVITDAVLVRMLLVPATMTILGKWNWWAPKPLRWVHSKLGFTE